MINFSRTIHIERSQHEVFDFMADPSNDTKWRDSAVSSEWVSEGPIGVGSKLKSVDKLLGRKIESTSEVTVWDPPHRFVDATISEMINVETPAPSVLRWPDLDVDLSLDIIRNPDKYPNIGKG